MKFKKLVCCAIVTAMVASAMAGCGSNTNTEDTEVAETEVVEATESVETEANTETEVEIVEETTEEEVDTEEVETETEEESKVEVESTTSSKTEEKSEVKKEETYKSTNTSTTKVEETPAHTHAWDGGTITSSATCTNNGVKTYKCSCGQTKTEAIGATGHNWVAQTTVVHHDAKGQFATVVTNQKYIACGCGEVFSTNAEFRVHDAATNYEHSYSTGTRKVKETKWIVDTEEYKICKYCKKTKS
jgi:Ni/Co efflux regulator RcnB